MISEKTKGIVLIALGIVLFSILIVSPKPEAITSFQKMLLFFFPVAFILSGAHCITLSGKSNQQVLNKKKTKIIGLIEILGGLFGLIGGAFLAYAWWYKFNFPWRIFLIATTLLQPLILFLRGLQNVYDFKNR